MQNPSRLNIIFTAFLFSSLVYLIVGFALTKTGWKPILTPDSPGSFLFGLFLAASVAIILIAFQITRAPATENFLQRLIFLFALAEVPSILGLAIFLLTGEFSYLVILWILSMIAFIAVKPPEQTNG